MKLKCYIINLDKSKDRFENISNSLSKLDIEFERVSAIDSNKLGEKPWEGVSDKLYSFCHGKKLVASEAGCFLSHYKAIKIFYESKNDFGLILEDDMGFNDDFVELMELAIENRKYWDMLKLNGSHSGTTICQRKLNAQYNIVAFLTRCTKAGAYLINKHAAKQYIDKLLPMHVPYDHSFDRAWKFGIKVRGIYPFPSEEKGFETTIDYKTIKKNYNPTYKRITVFLYRTYNEVYRILYGIINLLFIPKK